MLIGLIKSLSGNRIGEDVVAYGENGVMNEKLKQEQEQE
jgi:hypothetical protein